MFILKIIATILILIIFPQNCDSKDDIRTIVTKISNCPGDDNLDVNIKDFKINQVHVLYNI